MKKLVSSILALLLLVGCFALPVMAEEPTKIVFWHCMTGDAGEFLEQTIAAFNATTGAEQGIYVEAVFQGTYADATQKLNVILSGNAYDQLPDVMQMDATGKVTYFTSGVAYTVDDLLADAPETDVSMMLDAAMSNWNYSGVQLGMPFATSTTVLYYNKTMLESVGAGAPATLDDIAALAGKLPEGVTVYACVPNTPLLANWLGQLGSDVVDQHNGSEGTATQLVCVENGALATFLAQWKALASSGALSSTSASTDDFVGGTLAMMTSSSSNITSMLSKIDGRFELGVACYPSVNSDAATGATVSGSCLVMFNGAHTAQAWQLVQYLTSPEVQAAFAIATGYIPSNKDAMTTEQWTAFAADAPLYLVGYEQLAATPANMRSVTVGPSADFYYGIQNCVTEMLDEDLTVEETVELMQEELDGLLTQYNRANP